VDDVFNSLCQTIELYDQNQIKKMQELEERMADVP